MCEFKMDVRSCPMSNPIPEVNEEPRPPPGKGGGPAFEAGPPAGVLAYLEQQAQDNGRFRLEAVEVLRQRAHELALLLLGGAGGLGAYGLGQLDAPLVAWPLLAASGWAFFSGGLVAWKCLRSRSVWPLHNAPSQIWQAWHDCNARANGDADRAVADLREREVFRVQAAINSINGVNADVAKWLNRGYALAALLPVSGAAGAVLVCWLG